MVCRIVVASPRRACVIRRGVGAAQFDASRWVARAGAPSKGREGRRRASGRQREGDSRSQRRCVGGGGRLRRGPWGGVLLAHDVGGAVAPPAPIGIVARATREGTGKRRLWPCGRATASVSMASISAVSSSYCICMAHDDGPLSRRRPGGREREGHPHDGPHLGRPCSVVAGAPGARGVIRVKIFDF